MSKFSLPLLALASGLMLAPALPAFAQDASPRQIQTMIDNGQSGQAISQLKSVLNTHPDSGTAWYLLAEAQDARGNENAAAQALAKADQYAPGLPFANAAKVSALRAHINNGLSSAQAGERHHGGVSMVMLVIGGLILLFVVLRLVSGFRRQQVYRPFPGNPNMPYNNYPQGGPGPYGPGGGYGPAGGMGGGLGSSIVSGLAAGAGFAAGERIVDGMMGGHDAQAAPPQQDFGQSQDDGLMGNPGWDDGGSSDDDLNNNSW